MKPSAPDWSRFRHHKARAWVAALALFAGAHGFAQAACDGDGELPQPDGPVLALTTDPARSVLYVAGEFTRLGDDERNGLAAIDLGNCTVSDWDPNPDGAVRAFWLSEDGATLYVGGDFTAIGGQFRERLAALSTTTGQPTPWPPRVNDSVHVLKPSPSATSFYIGGAFTRVNNGTTLRHGFVELTRVNGIVVSQAFDFDSAGGAAVFAIERIGERLYLAGDFTSISDDVSGDPDAEDVHPRDGIAALESADIYTLSDWASATDAAAVRVLRVSPNGDRLYAGGDFTLAGGAGRTGIVALDPAAGTALTWNPRLDAGARAILPSLDRSMLYVGGRFGSVGSVLHDRLAAVSAFDASPVDGEFPAPATVCALHRTEDNDAGEYFLYAGGGHCDGIDDGGPAGFLAAFAAFPPEQNPPLTRAVPAGGLYNRDSIRPIVLECDDFGGAGCAATRFTIDGEEPDEESPLYATPINMSDGLVLKFFSVDFAGNIEAVRTEQYETEIVSPVTTASPLSRVFEGRNLAVTLSCADAGSGCAATYYTTDGSTPTTASTLYSGSVALTGTTVLQYFSIDVAGNREGVQRQEYVRNRGEVGALSGYEFLLALAGWWWARRRAA